MAIRFNSNLIRLWRGVSRGCPNIGIRFDRKVSNDEIENIYNKVLALLTKEYGEGETIDK
jgi:hypothetical protein